MYISKILSFLFILSVCLNLIANIEGKIIGGDPYESWEDGGQDFFVMFNSNIDNQVTLNSEDLSNNPQGDTCVEESAFKLSRNHVPEDAIVEKAYLVWMGAVDPSKLDQPTDNEVNLKFVQDGENPVSYNAEIKGVEDGDGKGKLLTDTASFEFEGMKFADNVEVGCTETAPGSIKKDQDLGYFTYRVDITDFFQKIAEDNAAAEKPEEGIFYGDYTFSGLECTDHDNYKCYTTMVSSWAILMVYRSEKIRSKKIYLYNGLSFVQGDKSEISVSGFELPEDPVVRLTSMVAEGDPSLVDPSEPPEGIYIIDQESDSKFKIYNDCNPMQGNYVEVFNSVSSIVNWDPEVEEDNRITCVSGFDDAEFNYGIDVDTFLLNSEENINLQPYLKKGNTFMGFLFSVNKDAIFTNFLVISVDNKGANFDIPLEASDTSKSSLNFPSDREKHFCACPSFDEGETPDYYCENKEFYFFIKVQNWGDDSSGEVFVSDEISEHLEYISGTTEMATVYDSSKDVFTDWTVIPDKDDGAFPLSGDGFKVENSMAMCDKGTWECSDTVMIRFKVKPRVGDVATPEISNIAYIKDSKDGNVYKTNRSYPLYLRPTTCVSDCISPTPESCGGVKTSESSDNDINDSDNIDNTDDYLNDEENEDAEKNTNDSNSENINDNEINDSENSSGCGCSLI